MDWRGILIVILIVWALIHTVFDFQQTKRIDQLEKKTK